MSIESLLRAAEAAGFAMASDENERPERKAIPETAPLAVAKTPKEVLSFSGVQAAVQEPFAHWTRAHFSNFLPVWHAKG